MAYIYHTRIGTKYWLINSVSSSSGQLLSSIGQPRQVGGNIPVKVNITNSNTMEFVIVDVKYLLIEERLLKSKVLLKFLYLLKKGKFNIDFDGKLSRFL